MDESYLRVLDSYDTVSQILAQLTLQAQAVGSERANRGRDVEELMAEVSKLKDENKVLLDEQNAAWRIVEEQAKKITDLEHRLGLD